MVAAGNSADDAPVHSGQVVAGEDGAQVPSFAVGERRFGAEVEFRIGAGSGGETQDEIAIISSAAAGLGSTAIGELSLRGRNGAEPESCQQCCFVEVFHIILFFYRIELI